MHSPPPPYPPPSPTPDPSEAATLLIFNAALDALAPIPPPLNPKKTHPGTIDATRATGGVLAQTPLTTKARRTCSYSGCCYTAPGYTMSIHEAGKHGTKVYLCGEPGCGFSTRWRQSLRLHEGNQHGVKRKMGGVKPAEVKTVEVKPVEVVEPKSRWKGFTAVEVLSSSDSDSDTATKAVVTVALQVPITRRTKRRRITRFDTLDEQVMYDEYELSMGSDYSDSHDLYV